MNVIPITVVRFDVSQAREHLQNFIFGGRFGGARVPRGIAPEMGSAFIGERLKPDSPAEAYARTGEVIRFYERPDVLPQLWLALTAHESKTEDLRRSAAAIEAIGDLGSPEDVTKAADYFDRVLVPHALAIDVVPAMLPALVALAPVGSPDKLAARLASEIDRQSKMPNDKGPEGIQYRKLRDMQRNDLPGTTYLMNGKKRILGLPPPERRRELVAVYMGESDLSDPQLETWAGRLLRSEAMHAEPEPVRAEFRRVLDAAAPKTPEDKGDQFAIVRAAQAILYLHGELSPEQREWYTHATEGAANFLWDDLNIAVIAPQRR